MKYQVTNNIIRLAVEDVLGEKLPIDGEDYGPQLPVTIEKKSPFDSFVDWLIPDCVVEYLFCQRYSNGKEKA